MTRTGSRIYGRGPEISRTLVSLEQEIGKGQFCVMRLVNIPVLSRGSFPDQILTWTAQPVRITDPKPPADLNIVMDPQAISKAIPRDNQVVDGNYLQSRDIDRNVEAAPYEIFPKHEVYVTRLNRN